MVEHGEEGSLRKEQILYLDMPEVSLARNADMIASLIDGREYDSLNVSCHWTRGYNPTFTFVTSQTGNPSGQR